MKIFSVVIYAAFIAMCVGQTIPDSMLYLGQTPPVYESKKFILPYRTGFFVAEKIAVSADNKEIFYSELNGYPSSSSKINKFKYSNDTWNGPFDLIQNYTNPIYSAGGDTLFIEDGQLKAWCLVKIDTSWSSPSRFWNSPHPQHNLQMVRTGKYYMTSDPVISVNGDISELVIQNSDTTVRNLGYPLNSSSNGMDFFIDKDDSYIIRIVKSNGLGDLYISYHNADGSWTNPKNLGTQVNSAQGWEWGPYVTNDNKYLFFTRQEGSIDIYWARVDNLIDSLRHTNFIPYVKKSIPDQTVIKDSLFNYQIPDSTFIDDDGNNTLRYTAALSRGNSLPVWLSFDSITCKFSGTPDTAAIYIIKVTATDTAGAGLSCTFKITTVNTPSEIDKEQSRLPKGFSLDQNYPNPFNPATTIKFSIAKSGMYSLRVFNILGQEIKQLINSELTVGIHKVSFDSGDLSSGIYTYRLTGNNVSLTKKMLLVK